MIVAPRHRPRAHCAADAKPPDVDWGEYAAAVHRWELITGRSAPYPTQPGRHGRPVLAPAFVEWLMGLPPGWATAEPLDLPRTAQLRALGNGVMPQQAEHALRLLLDDLIHPGQPPCNAPADTAQPRPSDRPKRAARASTARPRPAHPHARTTRRNLPSRTNTGLPR